MRWLGRLLARLDPDRADAARWARVEREAAEIAARRAPHLAQIGPHPASAAGTDDIRGRGLPLSLDYLAPGGGLPAVPRHRDWRWRNRRESDTESA